MGLTKLQEQALAKLTNGGNSALAAPLDSSRLAYLLAVVARDLEMEGVLEEHRDVPELFARVPSDTFALQGVSFLENYEALLAVTPDADTYLYCLGSLLKARLKYERILQSQPTPSVDQIAPRSLLQFGQMDPSALASFIFWRKWIFDIDNRAGQEAGYLFEPILAQAMGGVPFSAARSPVKRQGTGKGRQVDCVRNLPGQPKAYELKLRVTIAASGQGRWGEELSFPSDCRASGFQPVLVVFDATPNPKLSELCQKFLAEGGAVFVGDAAWEHIDSEAGKTMGRFLANYVRPPIASMIAEAPEQLPPITFSLEEGALIVSVDGDQLVVTRIDGDEADQPEREELPLDVDEISGGV